MQEQSNHELATAAPRQGVLLINLGTPDSTEIADVRRYLGEFLMDPYVLTAPWPIRKMIVGGFILPFRPKNSAEAYAKIWTEDGSPLLTGSQSLATHVGAALDVPVALSMRYGNPSIASGFAELQAKDVTEALVVPLYPQHADSTITTSLKAAEKALPDGMTMRTLAPFYHHPQHLAAWGELIKAHLPEKWDHILFSYHGVPESHLKKADPTNSHCLKVDNCCDRNSDAHAVCYRHQVMQTSQGIANFLSLREDQYSVTFQSRLGPIAWLKPYTDEVLAELPRQGVKHLAVACPAFVVDNLETLEEIGMQGKETFLEAGGESFHLIPCLNDSPLWVQSLAAICAESLGKPNDAAAVTVSAST